MIDGKLLIATANQGKVREIKAYLARLPIEFCSLVEIEAREFFQEDGQTFLENARGKSLFYSRIWEGWILGEDSGLEIDYLQGAPGVLSARFSAPEATDEKNIGKVLRLMDGVPFEKRQARFVSCMVLSCKGKIKAEIEEDVWGFITQAKSGKSGFGYDPIFFYPPLNTTFANLAPADKNKVSHRGRALKRLMEYLERL